MLIGQFHTRYRTSDFGFHSGDLFDEDALEGASRAFKHINLLVPSMARRHSGLDFAKKEAQIRYRLDSVSRQYWRDFDYDSRERAPQFKEQAQKLIAPLETLIQVMKGQYSYSIDAINDESTRLQIAITRPEDLVFNRCLLDSEEILRICRVASTTRHRKQERAVRWVNSCRNLAILWEFLTGETFSRNVKNSSASDSDVKRGVAKAFQSHSAQFVYMALVEIASPFGREHPWVTVGQVQEGIRALKGENWRLPVG